jgi:hypothetical protein
VSVSVPVPGPPPPIGFDPQTYLTGVFTHIAGMPVSQLKRLLPERFLDS